MSGGAPYLIALYIAETERSPPISPGTIADALDKSPSSTTEMLQRLEDRGLVALEPYTGATLTPEGTERARELHENYTTLARFFEDVLALDEYEREALFLAGALSPTVAERLAETLLDSDSDSPPNHSSQLFE